MSLRNPQLHTDVFLKVGVLGVWPPALVVCCKLALKGLAFTSPLKNRVTAWGFFCLAVIAVCHLCLYLHMYTKHAVTLRAYSLRHESLMPSALWKKNTPASIQSVAGHKSWESVGDNAMFHSIVFLVGDSHDLLHTWPTSRENTAAETWIMGCDLWTC